MFVVGTLPQTTSTHQSYSHCDFSNRERVHTLLFFSHLSCGQSRTEGAVEIVESAPPEGARACKQDFRAAGEREVEEGRPSW